MITRANDAIRHLHHAASVLDDVDVGAAICHIQLAIDLIQSEIDAVETYRAAPACRNMRGDHRLDVTPATGRAAGEHVPQHETRASLMRN
ncbi:hypothetical protein [Sphingomonas sp. GV3]|uniref:hypothetical protein n=1 Tax=Sphingomonas sp. GV3 TaxID=3040671 RepID=UPI00280B407A|nr:hypothetical protein [Sphingomonas sp. GV3]